MIIYMSTNEILILYSETSDYTHADQRGKCKSGLSYNSDQCSTSPRLCTPLITKLFKHVLCWSVNTSKKDKMLRQSRIPWVFLAFLVNSSIFGKDWGTTAVLVKDVPGISDLAHDVSHRMQYLGDQKAIPRIKYSESLPGISVKEFRPSDLPGTYETNLAVNESCPTSLIFADENVEKTTINGFEAVLYPISGLSINGQRCESGEPLQIIKSSVLFPSPNASEIAGELAIETDYLYIQNPTTATCGSVSYPTAAMFAVFDPSDITVGDASQGTLSFKKDIKTLGYTDLDRCTMALIQTKGVTTSIDPDDGDPIPGPEKRKLSTGAIVGIAVGGIGFFSVLTILTVLVIQHRRNARAEHPDGGVTDPYNVDDLRTPPNEPGDD